MTPSPSFGGFIITYKRPEILPSTIDTVLSQSHPPDVLVIVDNDPEESAARLVKSHGDRRLRYRSAGGNVGPAGGAAVGLRELFDLGCEWMWWGDDDDPPQMQSAFEQMLGLRDCVVRDENGVGVVAVSGSRIDPPHRPRNASRQQRPVATSGSARCLQRWQQQSDILTWGRERGGLPEQRTLLRVRGPRVFSSNPKRWLRHHGLGAALSPSPRHEWPAKRAEKWPRLLAT